jgi:hypothetical protein
MKKKRFMFSDYRISVGTNKNKKQNIIINHHHIQPQQVIKPNGISINVVFDIIVIIVFLILIFK